MDLNHGPPELQSDALPLSYVSVCAPAGNQTQSSTLVRWNHFS